MYKVHLYNCRNGDRVCENVDLMKVFKELKAGEGDIHVSSSVPMVNIFLMKTKANSPFLYDLLVFRIPHQMQVTKTTLTMR